MKKHSGGFWNKFTFQFERDEKARADLAFQMHNNYALFPTKQVVRRKGPESRESIVIESRTMDEFIASLDASKDAFLSQLFLKCDVYDAAQKDLVGEVQNIMQADLLHLLEFVINFIRPKHIRC